LLEQLLLALRYSLHDNSEKVRVAFVDLLLKVKAVRAAKVGAEDCSHTDMGWIGASPFVPQKEPWWPIFIHPLLPIVALYFFCAFH
jgi:hypothetical protein